jgi:DNA-binding response OmpR family regulator
MHRPRVLIVDDDPMIRDMIRRNLEEEHYEVRVAADGEGCLELSQQEPPDLVLLASYLPDIDAREIARWLRSERATRSVPIILLTEFEHLNGNGNGYLNGDDPDTPAADYVAKPFSPEMLRTKVRHVLDRHAG